MHVLIDLLLAFRDKRLMQNMIQNVIIESTMAPSFSSYTYLHIDICIHVYSRNIYQRYLLHGVALMRTNTALNEYFGH